MRCPRGHWYDDSLPSCPICGIGLSVTARQAMGSRMTGGAATDDDVTVAVGADDDVTVAIGGADDDITIAGLETDDEVTVSYFSTLEHGKPVVGWLVCTVGNERGRDYRLHAAKNFVGRSAHMDLAVFDDPRIVRDRHFSIIYDPKGNEFYAMPGEGAVSVNGEPLTDAKKMQDGDILAFGGSEFVFVPFCREGRTWEHTEQGQ